MSNEGGKKKSKKGLIIGIIIAVVVLFLLLLLVGGSDEEDYDSSYDYEEVGTDSDEEYFTSDINLGDSDEFPRGTCDKLEGTTVVVSIFASDNSTSWNFDNEADVQLYNDMCLYMRRGLDWLEGEAGNYGKNVKFISDFMADKDLFYQVKLDDDFGDGQNHIATVKIFMDENMSGVGAKLMEKYNADNILFAFFFNMPEDTPMVSCAYPFYGTYRGYDMPYEAALFSSYVYGAQQGPAMYAHEVLHLFAAPDLYYADEGGNNFGITQEFVDYCEANHKNEIMFSNYDIYNNCVDTEKVTNDLTDLTAYYIGWTDSCQDCIDFGMTEREEK